jgi:hypothetical protein
VPLVHERAQGPPTDPSATFLLYAATKLVQQNDPLLDLMAMPMRTMLSPLALQMLRIIIYKNKTVDSSVFDSILQFVEKGVTTTPKSITTILRLAPHYSNKPKWMTDGQIDLFGFEYNTATPAILFWQQKMLPLSTEAADLQRKCGVLYSTAKYELQDLRDALNLAKSQLLPEQILRPPCNMQLSYASPLPARKCSRLARHSSGSHSLGASALLCSATWPSQQPMPC